MRPILAAIALLAVATAGASAGLIDTRTSAGDGATVDGVLGANEYGVGNANVYNGGGSGFGGTLGGGALYMDSDGTNLYIAFDPGADLNDNVVIHLDTRPGGFTDADMDDTADPGRNLLSNLTRDVDDTFAILPDFGVVIGGFGIVVFELNAGSTPNHLTFVQFDGTFTGNSATLVREIAIPLASIGSGPADVIDFFVNYSSDTNFMSNESIPGQPFNSGGNLGFDNDGSSNPVDHPNFDRFNTPEPASVAMLALGAVVVMRRRRDA